MSEHRRDEGRGPHHQQQAGPNGAIEQPSNGRDDEPAAPDPTAGQPGGGGGDGPTTQGAIEQPSDGGGGKEGEGADKSAERP